MYIALAVSTRAGETEALMRRSSVIAALVTLLVFSSVGLLTVLNIAP